MKKQGQQPDTLTPQRKHRKLLKDGSGAEVWPEAVEMTFVAGLREYWKSPYATYSQSRGRSRWRNQFLVDFLQRHGIVRTKKQVASHIQVLRNMWKGQPEFHLVAGGDESIDSIPIKEEGDAGQSVPFDWEGSASPSPDFSPPDSNSDFPLTPEQRPNLHPSEHVLGPTIKQEGSPGRLSFASPSTSPYSTYSPSLPHAEYSPASPTSFKPLPPGYPYSPHSTMPASTPFSRVGQNRVMKFVLSAQGMTPFSVNIDLLRQPEPLPRSFALKIKLSVPELDDPPSPTTLQGFNGAIVVANPWTAAKCSTKVYSPNNFSEEHEDLHISHIDPEGVHAFLPDSQLTRCRLFDDNLLTIITQDIIVDGLPLLSLLYELHRNHDLGPSCEYLLSKSYSPGENPFGGPASPQIPPYATHSRRPSQLSSSFPLPAYPYSMFNPLPTQ